MMWLKRRIRDWVDQVNDEDYGVESRIGLRVDEKDTPEDLDSYTLRVWKANGGRCIQYKRFDRYNDKLHTDLYVVSEEEDLGEAVKNIVIQQALQGQ
jgi:hypothetical protein